MSIDIAAMDAAQKLAFARATGSVLLSSGKITTPTLYVDIVLPANYYFQFIMRDFALSSPDLFGGALSLDGGTTFFNDSTNFDSYGYVGSTARTQGSSPADGQFDGGMTYDSCFYVGGNTNFSKGDSISWIYPGSDDDAARIIIDAWALDDTVSPVVFKSGRDMWFPSPAATTPIAPGAANLIRIFGYGNGNCNPPNGDTMITGGSYSLIGYPEPA